MHKQSSPLLLHPTLWAQKPVDLDLCLKDLGVCGKDLLHGTFLALHVSTLVDLPWPQARSTLHIVRWPGRTKSSVLCKNT